VFSDLKVACAFRVQHENKLTVIMNRALNCVSSQKYLVFFRRLLESLPVFLKTLYQVLCFLTYIDDICNVITHLKFLIFADDIKIFRAIKSFDDFTQLHTRLVH
jgi:hypothetical protein